MARKLAFSSVMTALTVVSLYGSVALPTGRIALLAIASLCVLITHAECGTKYSFIQYITTALISALIIPYKSQVILFIAFIGYYPIVKSYIERIESVWLEWVVKILFFNALFILAYFVINSFLLNYIHFGSIFMYALAHLFWVFIIFEILFVIYDYLLSLFVSYYINVLQKRIKF